MVLCGWIDVWHSRDLTFRPEIHNFVPSVRISFAAYPRKRQQLATFCQQLTIVFFQWKSGFWILFAMQYQEYKVGWYQSCDDPLNDLRISVCVVLNFICRNAGNAGLSCLKHQPSCLFEFIKPVTFEQGFQIKLSTALGCCVCARTVMLNLPEGTVTGNRMHQCENTIGYLELKISPAKTNRTSSVTTHQLKMSTCSQADHQSMCMKQPACVTSTS